MMKNVNRDLRTQTAQLTYNFLERKKEKEREVYIRQKGMVKEGEKKISKNAKLHSKFK